MKALFVEVRRGDLAAVRDRLDRDPALVNATAKAPPKKDDGQSPLQVAIKSGQFAVAHLLLDRGASVNFMETSALNSWRAPVLHDAIRAAVMRARWLRPVYGSPDGEGWELSHSREASDVAYALLERIVDAGADVACVDSYGNGALGRAVLDARQVLPTYRHMEPDWVDPKPLNPELTEDLERIFHLLLVHGGDPEAVDARRGQTIRELYKPEPVGRFL